MEYRLRLLKILIDGYGTARQITRKSKNYIKMAVLPELFSWKTSALIIKSPVIKVTSAIPLLGYILLYSEQTNQIFDLIPSLSGHGLIDSDLKANFIYWGAILLLLSIILFYILALKVIKRFSYDEEYSSEEFSSFDNDKLSSLFVKASLNNIYLPLPKNIEFLRIKNNHISIDDKIDLLFVFKKLGIYQYLQLSAEDAITRINSISPEKFKLVKDNFTVNLKFYDEYTFFNSSEIRQIDSIINDIKEDYIFYKIIHQLLGPHIKYHDELENHLKSFFEVFQNLEKSEHLKRFIQNRSTSVSEVLYNTIMRILSNNSYFSASMPYKTLLKLEFRRLNRSKKLQNFIVSITSWSGLALVSAPSIDVMYRLIARFVYSLT
ncbi:membrane hypothetical protein [Oceanicaulis sp. 350]|nr:membrane hypothetical protein [Oceanicaulis sp. 350]